MNDFDSKIEEVTGSYLNSNGIEIIQVNVGLRCNNLCAHCHLQASPERTEAMAWPTMQLILDVAHRVHPKFVDITGGAPELNPLLCRFIRALRGDGQSVQVRTNFLFIHLSGEVWGDRAMFARREALEGCLAAMDVPLLEDVRLSKCMRGRGKVIVLKEKVVTSAEGFMTQGRVRHAWKALRCRLLYALGASPQRMYDYYYKR